MSEYASSPLPIRVLEDRFADRWPSADEWRGLRTDPRAGVQSLVRRLEARQAREQLAEGSLEQRLVYERPLWLAGQLVAGCDEAGVAPLAGPIVAAAVILPPEPLIPQVHDSKKLSESTRERLSAQIRSQAIAWAVGEASPAEVDLLNPFHAGLLAMRRAVEGLSVAPQHVLVDARTIPGIGARQTPLIGGDARSYLIGAASIVAKVHRDRGMAEMDQLYPGYGFAAHKGYPVPLHLDTLRRLGPCPIHRRSYAPVREATGSPSTPERGPGRQQRLW